MSQGTPGLPPELLANMPHVQAQWRVQGGKLIAFVEHCPCCGVDFGLAGEPDYLASGEAKHYCRGCQQLLRVTAVGSKPEVPDHPWDVHVGVQE